MNLNPRAIALQGIGFDPIAVVTFGFVTIEISPAFFDDDTGQGGYIPIQRKDKYNITIRISRFGRVWNYQSIITDTFARILAKLLRVKLPEEPKISIDGVTLKTDSTPDIKVTKK